jgi:hypothetical protein
MQVVRVVCVGEAKLGNRVGNPYGGDVDTPGPWFGVVVVVWGWRVVSRRGWGWILIYALKLIEEELRGSRPAISLRSRAAAVLPIPGALTPEEGRSGYWARTGRAKRRTEKGLGVILLIGE